MGWVTFGILLALWVLGWSVLGLASTADDRAIARYEAERDAFESLFDQ